MTGYELMFIAAALSSRVGGSGVGNSSPEWRASYKTEGNGCFEGLCGYVDHPVGSLTLFIKKMNELKGVWVTYGYSW